jgi:hypothetical protein
VQEQQREQRPLLRPPQVDRLAVEKHLEWAENTQFEHAMVCNTAHALAPY